MNALVAFYMVSLTWAFPYNTNALWPDTPCHCVDALAQLRHTRHLENQIALLQAQVAARKLQVRLLEVGVY